MAHQGPGVVGSLRPLLGGHQAGPPPPPSRTLKRQGLRGSTHLRLRGPSLIANQQQVALSVHHDLLLKPATCHAHTHTHRRAGYAGANQAQARQRRGLRLWKNTAPPCNLAVAMVTVPMGTSKSRASLVLQATRWLGTQDPAIVTQCASSEVSWPRHWGRSWA